MVGVKRLRTRHCDGCGVTAARAKAKGGLCEITMEVDFVKPTKRTVLTCCTDCLAMLGDVINGYLRKENK